MNEPVVFLSPSAKDYQISPITGISEAEIMKLLSDEIKSNLIDYGIKVIEGQSGATPAQNAESSNNSHVSLHLVLTSLRATSPSQRGIKIYYSSSDSQSRDFAGTIATNLKEIYPLPDLVTTEPNGALVELINTTSPAVILSISNQSNPEDVEWLSENLGDIAQNISSSISDVLGTESETKPLTALGLVNGVSGYATVRKSPSPTSKIITRLQNGTPVRIIGKIGTWYAIIAARIEGYVQESEITAETPEA
jgi:N-acetylmuramoyl-L-alanine amidase